MAVAKGYSASFLLGTNVVAHLKNVSVSIDGDTLDITSFDSAGFREFIAGLRGGTIDISGDFDSADTTGQVALLTAQLAGTTLTTTQKPKILWDGVNGITADGVISSLSIDAAVDGIVGFSCSITADGTIAVV